MTGPAPSAHLAPQRGDAPDQVQRLTRFRRLYPHITILPIREGGLTWQALIPEDDGETIITRHELGLLLGKLHELGYTLDRPLAGALPGQTGGNPRAGQDHALDRRDRQAADHAAR